jgi:hypothetical protein
MQSHKKNNGSSIRLLILTKGEVGFGVGFKVGLKVGFLPFPCLNPTLILPKTEAIEIMFSFILRLDLK